MISVESRLEAILQCLFLPKNNFSKDLNTNYYLFSRYVDSILTASSNKQLMESIIVHVVNMSNSVLWRAA